jgi:hypothetical protein
MPYNKDNKQVTVTVNLEELMNIVAALNAFNIMYLQSGGPSSAPGFQAAVRLQENLESRYVAEGGYVPTEADYEEAKVCWEGRIPLKTENLRQGPRVTSEGGPESEF